MPDSWVTDEAHWEKAKARVREQYPDVPEGSERFYRLVTAIYKKMTGYRPKGKRKSMIVWVPARLLRKALPPGPPEDKPLEEHRIKYAHRTPPKEYREEGARSPKDYADPKNYKYPLHTAENVRAAITYFSRPKNQKMYTPEERRAIWRRILRAAKRFGVEVSDAVKRRATEKSSASGVLDYIRKARGEKLHNTAEEAQGGLEEIRSRVTGKVEALVRQVLDGTWSVRFLDTRLAPRSRKGMRSKEEALEYARRVIAQFDEALGGDAAAKRALS